jgi:hypothetical protein
MKCQMNQFNLQLYNFMYTAIDMTSLTSQFTISWMQSADKKHNQIATKTLKKVSRFLSDFRVSLRCFKKHDRHTCFKKPVKAGA